ncbi:MAG: hypothetical protein WB471_05695 [Nocardioides sp.]
MERPVDGSAAREAGREAGREVGLCWSCHHALGVGRYCVNCGQLKHHPAGGAPAHRTPTSPPPVYGPPPPARYPLFADEAGRGPTEQSPAAYRQSSTLAEATAVPGGLPPGAHPIELSSSVPHGRGTRSRRWTAIAAGAVAAVLLGAGAMKLLGGGSDPDLTADGSAAGPSGRASAPAGTDAGSQGDDQVGPFDLTRSVEVSPPATADPSRDVRGNAVRYEAFNMLDGQRDTAWRMPGDGSGQEVVFRLDEPARITKVGLINGYAKVEPGYDGYAANRRIISVEWVFADGTAVPQTLVEGLGVQSVPVGDAVGEVISDVVTLRIVSVTEPASGPSGRDYTAISEVSLIGTPAEGS